MTKKVPISDTGMATIGNDRGAPGLQEQDDDQHHQHDRFEQRLDHLVDRLLNELGGVVGDAVAHPRGKLLASSPMVASTLAAVASAFEPGRWKIAIAVATWLSR